MIIETVLLALGIGSVASTEITGRGLTDHAISAANNRDCKIVRIVQNESVCQDAPKATVTVLPVKSSDDNNIEISEAIWAKRVRKQ